MPFYKQFNSLHNSHVCTQTFDLYDDAISSNHYKIVLLINIEGFFIQILFYCASFIFYEATILSLQTLHL
jgi:hypothetical protein